MSRENFFQNPRLPFVEARISEDSRHHFKPHMHRRFSLGAVTEGNTVYRVGEQELFLEPGRLALINPEILHSCNPSPGLSRSFSMLYLDVAWCVQVQQMLWQVESYIPVNCALLKNETLYQHYIKTIDVLVDTPHDLLAKEMHLVLLLSEVFQESCDPQTLMPEASLAYAEQLKQLLADNLDQEITLVQAADQLNVNPYTLIRQFKKLTGITPHAYRMNCRIEYARTLLQQGKDIVDTALACGFFDQSHFHHHFKAMTTVTPKLYQDNFRHC